MEKHPESNSRVMVTIIGHKDCESCRVLIQELEPVRIMPNIKFRAVDVSEETPPPFARGHIVPATYIGEKLWRYGKFSRRALEKRLEQENPNYHRDGTK